MGNRGYHSSYRAAAARRGFGGRGFQAPRRPSSTDLGFVAPVAVPAAAPVAAAARSYAGLRVGARVAARFVPWLGAGLIAYELYRWYRGREGPYVDMAGWELVCSTPTCGVRSNEPVNKWFGMSLPEPVGCQAACAQFLGPPGFAVVPSNNVMLAIHCFKPHPLIDYVSDSAQTWKRGVGVPLPKYYPDGLPGTWAPPADPQPGPTWLPSLDPWVLPVLQPVPDADPLPFHLQPRRQENPWRSPSEQTETGPRPASPPVSPYPPGVGVTLTPPARDGDTDTDGGVAPPVPPNTPSGPTVVTPPFRPEPPGPRVKERKVLVGGHGGLRFVRAVVGGVTEGLDALNALWKALPRDRRTRRATQWQRAQDVYNNWQYIDAGQALWNLASNEVEDRFYGAIGRRLGEAGARVGRPVGFGTGTWDTAGFEYARDYQRQQEREKRKRRKRD